MDFSAVDWKLLVTVAALVLSGISLYFTKVNWLQSNRPIVTAFITDDSSGIGNATFNLVIANTGTRPATRVRMIASNEDIKNLLEPGVSDKYFKMIESNFLPDSEIPLLRNGEELTTSFGAFTSAGSTEKWLRYGAQTDIVICYQDLDGRKYKTEQPLKVYARHGFGGGVWTESKTG
jgi:hypothetical protein